MKKNQQSIDGFTPRRRARTEISGGDKNQVSTKKKTPAVVKKKEKLAEKKSLDEALNVIEIDGSYAEKSQHHVRGERTRRRENLEKRKREISPKIEKKLEKINAKREKKGKKIFTMERFLLRRKIRRVILTVAIILVGIFSSKIFGFISKNFGTIQKITGGNGSIFDLAKTVKLKQDDDGRTNVLIFGTSPEGWEGEDLADSIMVLSLNQETGAARTISLPRDLWVKHECPYFLGTTAGKLNESYACGKYSEGVFASRGVSEEKKKSAEKLGQDELASAVERVLGLKIHYKVHANWQVLVESIDAIGGIDVKIEVWDGSPYMYDVATKIRYKNGETVHMDGETALAFSRARGSAGGVGFSGGNFDRERNQQKVLKATLEKIGKEKFNFDALSGVSEALGGNIQTTFEVAELKAGLDLALKHSSSNIKSLPLVGAESGDLLTTDSISGVSVVVPTEGTYDYSQIQKLVAKNTKSGDFLSEEAKIVILNGTEISGLAGKKRTELEKDGFEILNIGDYGDEVVASSKIFDISGKVPLTLKKLQEKLGISKAENINSKLEKYKNSADIVLVIGEK